MYMHTISCTCSVTKQQHAWTAHYRKATCFIFRGVEELGPNFCLPTCPKMFNVFHPVSHTFILSACHWYLCVGKLFSIATYSCCTLFKYDVYLYITAPAYATWYTPPLPSLTLLRIAWSHWWSRQLPPNLCSCPITRDEKDSILVRTVDSSCSLNVWLYCVSWYK